MSLVKFIFGERKPVNQEFSKAYETTFNQVVTSNFADRELNFNVKYNLDAEFFIDSSKKIAYMIGEIKDR